MQKDVWDAAFYVRKKRKYIFIYLSIVVRKTQANETGYLWLGVGRSEIAGWGGMTLL